MGEKQPIWIFKFCHDENETWIEYREEEGIGHFDNIYLPTQIIKNKYNAPDAFEYEGVKYVRLDDRNKYLPLDEFKKLLSDLENI